MPKMPSQYYKSHNCSFSTTPTSTDIKLKLLAENLKKQIQNKIPFEEDYIVHTALGGFKLGDTIKNLTFEQILIRLLDLRLSEVPGGSDNPNKPDLPGKPEDLPENPTVDQVVNVIEASQVPLLQVNSVGELEELNFSQKIFNEQTYLEPPTQVETIFYKTLDASGNIIEAGYQHMTELKEMYYMVALPDYMIIGQNTKIQTWDDLSQCWVDVQVPLTKLPEDIKEAFEAAGFSAPEVPAGYTLWADLTNIDAGMTYRFVLI